jgi:hypothetical protein
MKAVLSTPPTYSIFASRDWAFATTTPGTGIHAASRSSLVASSGTGDSTPELSKSYSIEDGPTTVARMSFSSMVSAAAGAHILLVECRGGQANDDLLLNNACLQSVSESPPTSDKKQTP